MPPLLVALVLAGFPAAVSPASFYADNGLQQTVIVDRLPRAQRRFVRQEVLQLLGLHHKPRRSAAPAESTANSAPSYMLGLYNLIEHEDDLVHWHSPAVHGMNSVRLDNLTLRGTEQNIRRADMIMSFVNHGEWDFGRNSRVSTDQTPKPLIRNPLPSITAPISMVPWVQSALRRLITDAVLFN